MEMDNRIRDDVRSIVLNIVANAIWLLLTFASGAAAVLFFRYTKGSGFSSKLTIPAWLVLLAAVISFGSAVFVFVTNKRASVVRGRLSATRANVALLASRRKVNINGRVIRSTRFGRWPPGENLPHRTDFREELDKAILQEGAEVRRIWNVSSIDDVRRLREMIEKYKCQDNHSIRAYFGLPDYAMPEILVVDGRGASISFVSTRTPHGLDWAVHVKRPDLVHVIRDYFDVLWDRAERILDAGEIVPRGRDTIEEFEANLTTPQK